MRLNFQQDSRQHSDLSSPGLHSAEPETLCSESLKPPAPARAGDKGTGLLSPCLRAETIVTITTSMGIALGSAKA